MFKTTLSLGGHDGTNEEDIMVRRNLLFLFLLLNVAPTG